MNKVNARIFLGFMLCFSFLLAGCKPIIRINNDAMQVNESTGKDTQVNTDNTDNILGKEEVIYKGTILAGNVAKVIDFNKVDYDAALKSDKLIVLYFYATWCPICKEEIKNFYEAFNQLTNVQVVGFRVNYNDDDTDDAEKALAREFGVAYQHTKVFVKNGERVLKSPESWDTQRYISEINSQLSK